MYAGGRGGLVGAGGKRERAGCAESEVFVWLYEMDCTAAKEWTEQVDADAARSSKRVLVGFSAGHKPYK